MLKKENRSTKFLACIFSIGVFAPTHLTAQARLDNLAVTVKGASREFAYTNKQDAFFYGETDAEDTRSSWQGFNVFGHEYLDDYIVLVDGKKLERKRATTVVYPDYLKRTYPNGIVEELHLADTIPLFSVTITSAKHPVSVEIIPLVTDGSQLQGFIVGHREHALMLARRVHPKRTPTESYPVWLAMSGKDFEAVHTARTIGKRFAPFSMNFGKSLSHTIAFAVADEPPVADSLIQAYLADHAKYDRQRRQRMEQLLNDSRAETKSERLDKALAWAKLSLDALVMNQVTKGIFAGLPWFNNYWGRDTFISLPGATLVTGRFTEAKEILRSFARYQQTDTSSTDYGRIPNIVTTTEKAYNTADGTPRFVMMARDYSERSGDTAFIAEAYPIVKRSIEGTLQYHTDSLGFLTHADAETWMDAVGPDGAWSPRGNRANDIQALWIRQLEAGAWFALKMEDGPSARKWQEIAERTRTNFHRMFVSADGQMVYDHLKTDGSADSQLRPNQIFSAMLLPDSLRAGIVRTVVNNLTYEYGVASLSQNDDNFHPYHQHPPFYPKDAAYHNGTVWTWLQGPVISELCRFDKQELAAKITMNTVHQILDRGAVGTQSELIDAIARPGEKEPRLSGTFSQAWNLAEFVRNFYDDYLGVRVERLTHTMWLRPRIPKFMGKVKATINLNGRAFPIEVDQHSKVQTVVLNSEQLRVGGPVVIELPSHDGQMMRSTFRLTPKSIAKLTVDGNAIQVTLNGQPYEHQSMFMALPKYDKVLEPLTFAKPKLRRGLRSLRGFDHPMLSHAQIKTRNIAATTLIDADDPEGDDNGTGGYVYPANQNFVPGIFDVRHITVTCDKKNAYFTLKFTTLSNPGWHPEYGFQLTFIAIAIDEDDFSGSGTRLVPQNAHYVLDEQHAYERLILVGGGVEVRDKDGKTLCAYIPAEQDAPNPLGNAHTGTISFAIPLSYLGKPSAKWTFTILSGGQDDHGGAGLGEFRTVNKEAGEWNGGGKMKPDEPNVYDVVIAPTR